MKMKSKRDRMKHFFMNFCTERTNQQVVSGGLFSGVFFFFISMFLLSREYHGAQKSYTPYICQANA